MPICLLIPDETLSINYDTSRRDFYPLGFLGISWTFFVQVILPLSNHQYHIFPAELYSLVYVGKDGK